MSGYVRLISDKFEMVSLPESRVHDVPSDSGDTVQRSTRTSERFKLSFCHDCTTQAIIQRFDNALHFPSTIYHQ
jgi:hypothetical protein